MESILQSVPQLAPYQPTMAALILLCIVILTQSFLAGALGLGKSDEVPGRPLKGDHKDASFRILRTYANSTENFSVLIATAFLAVLAGVDAFWVNLLVWLHVAIRILYWAIYYAGMGRVAAGPRTFTYVLGWLVNSVLAVLTAYVMLI